MSITRVTDTDDDGTGTTGTIHNNAWKTAIWDALDGRWSENSTTSTGNQDNFAYSEADVLRCNNATTITLRGLLAPASPLKPGKRLIVVSVGAGTVVLNDQDTNSTAANRIITGAGAALTLAAGTGYATLEYDSVTARWRVVGSSVANTVNLASGVTGTLPKANGGTGVTSLALNITLTDGSTPALDASLVPFFLTGVFRLAAGGDRTIGIPSNPTAGQKIVIEHFASSAGRTLALNSGTGGFRFGSDIASLSQTASGKTDYIGCIYNDTDNKWDVVAVSKGY